MCLWQCAKALGVNPDDYTRGGSAGWKSYGESFEKIGDTDGFYQAVWLQKEDGQYPTALDITYILSNIQAGDVLVFGNSNADKKAAGWNPGHVEFYVGKENDKVSVSVKKKELVIERTI